MAICCWRRRLRIIGIGDIADIADIDVDRRHCRNWPANRLRSRSLLLMVVRPVPPASKVDRLGAIDDHCIRARRLVVVAVMIETAIALFSLMLPIWSRMAVEFWLKGEADVCVSLIVLFDSVVASGCSTKCCHAAARPSGQHWPDCLYLCTAAATPLLVCQLLRRRRWQRVCRSRLACHVQRFTVVKAPI